MFSEAQHETPAGAFGNGYKHRIWDGAEPASGQQKRSSYVGTTGPEQRAAGENLSKSLGHVPK
jgi:hypothetical protein